MYYKQIIKSHRLKLNRPSKRWHCNKRGCITLWFLCFYRLRSLLIPRWKKNDEIDNFISDLMQFLYLRYLHGLREMRNLYTQHHTHGLWVSSLQPPALLGDNLVVAVLATSCQLVTTMLLLVRVSTKACARFTGKRMKERKEHALAYYRWKITVDKVWDKYDFFCKIPNKQERSVNFYTKVE